MNYLYFHGTPKENVKSIIEKGLKLEYGRAVFSINPYDAIKYGPVRFEESVKNINKTAIIICDDLDGLIKPALDSNISIDNKTKTITGWPNRYRSNAFGYFSKNLIKDFIGILILDKKLTEVYKKLIDDIKSGSLTENKVTKAQRILESVLSDKNSWLLKTNISQTEITKAMTNGLIKQTIDSHLRKIELNSYKFRGWKIINKGDHPVQYYNSVDDMEKAKENIKKMVSMFK